MSKRYDVMHVKNFEVKNGEIAKLDKAIWSRIGVGFVNKDGSINVKFDASPFGLGEIQLRLHVDREERGEKFE